MDHTAEHAAAAAQAMNGRNDTLWMAVHDRLGRPPVDARECLSEIVKMSHYERVCYGAESWSDDSKRFCPRCRTDHRGSGCPESDALARGEAA